MRIDGIVGWGAALVSAVVAIVASAAETNCVHVVTPATFAAVCQRVSREHFEARNCVYNDEFVFQPGVYDFAQYVATAPRSDLGVIAFEIGSGRVILRGETGNPGDVIFEGTNCSQHAVFVVGKGEFALRGITFRNFHYTGRQEGSALYVDCIKLTNQIDDCVFLANSSSNAGGAAVGGNYRNCRFERNYSAKSAGAWNAGAWRQLSGAAVDCVFSGNVARVNGGAAAGGQFTNCLFVANVAREGFGGALVPSFPRNTVICCRFVDNAAPCVLYGDYRNQIWKSSVVVECAADQFRDNEFVSWGFGEYGRRDGQRGVDRVVLKDGDSLGDALAFLRANRTPGRRAEVILGDGAYRLTNALELTGLDANLTLRALNRGQAWITGGWNFRGREFRPSERPGLLAVRVPDEFHTNFWGSFTGAMHPFSGRVKRVNLEAHDRYESPSYPVFAIDGAAMLPGRWPRGDQYANGNSKNIVQAPGAGSTNLLYRVPGLDASKWNFADANIWFWGHLSGCAYSMEAWQVAGYDAERQAFDLGKGKMAAGPEFKILNVLEETDEPGEWCYDRKSHQLYLCPPAGFGPDSLCTLGVDFDAFIVADTEGLRLEGLNFAGKIGTAAVILAGVGRNNTIVGCRFSALGYGGGVSMRGEGNVVRSCDFYDIQGTAAKVEGGDIRSLAYASNRIENCNFRHCCYAQVGGHAPNVSIGGCGNWLSHNEISDSIGPGIGFGGTETFIEYNRLWNVNLRNGDSAVVCTGGLGAYGAVVRYNDVAGGIPGRLAHGIYLDDFSCGVRVYGNIVHDVGQWGMWLGGGRDHVISNNVFFGTVGGIHTDNRGLFWPAWANKEQCWRGWCQQYGLPDSPFARRYPKFSRWWEEDGPKLLTAPIGNEIVNNLFLDMEHMSSQIHLCLQRDYPLKRNYFRGNLSVRTRSEQPKADVESEQDFHRKPGLGNCWRAYFPVRAISGTAAEPLDLGFFRVPTERRGQQGDWGLKPEARVLREIPGFEPLPAAQIGNYADEWRK